MPTKTYLASPIGFSPENDSYRNNIKKHLADIGCDVLDPWEQEAVSIKIAEAMAKDMICKVN